MARKNIKSATDQRRFTLVYNDFLESKLLNYYEKMIFISLKKFADNETLKAFPSLKTLHEMTGISRGQLQISIDKMKEKGVISVEHRATKEKGHQSNIYTLYDYREVWIVGSSEEVAAVIDEIEEKKLVNMLEAKGYTVTKEKELVSDTDQSTDANPQISQLINSDNTISDGKSQDTYNVFTRDMLNDIYDYDILKNDRLDQIGLFDSLIELILEVLNTTKKTERVNQEDKPIEIVKSRFLKLNYMHLIYVVEEISRQTTSIKNIKAYQITSLFNSYTTMELHYTNKVQHDMNQ